MFGVLAALGCPGRGAPLELQSSPAPNLGSQIFRDCWVFLWWLVKWAGTPKTRNIPLWASSFSAREAEVSAVTLHPTWG